MPHEIGALIKDERTRLGWEQGDLGQRLSPPVQQQTVSRWERGGSRPRRAVVVELARLFQVDPGKFLEAAGYSRGADQPQSVQLPVRPLSTILPVWELPSDKFEELITDVAQVLQPDTFVSRFGGPGHTQHGVDVVAEKDSRYVRTYQCKRHKEFGPQDVREAVAEVTIEADAHFLVLSRRSASPQARQEMQNHAGWTLWDAENISRKIRELPQERAVRIVDTFFPGWRESFLGIAEPGPWLTTEEFFSTFSPSSLYNHEWTLVGRDRELAAIQKFINTPRQRIVLLAGRGGIGKTRLLREVAQTASTNVRFVKTGADVRAENFELLSSTEPDLLIVDDAHDRDDLAVLISDALRRNPNLTVLLSVRPFALGMLGADFRRLGVRIEDTPKIDLEDLAVADAEQLAAQALGRTLPDRLATRLGRVTADSPFLTVIAGVLIQRGALHPACLDHEETIKQEVLRTFRDVAVDGGAGGDTELRGAILDGIAAVQPFRSGDQDFQNTLSGLTGVPYDRAVRHIRSFEDAGVILRRGDSLRIVPDILGDVVLGMACFDEASATPTGYLERAIQATSGEATRHLFVNATRIAWQIRHDHPASPPLADALWDSVDAAAESAHILGRISLLKLLKKVAYYEPARSLKVVRWLIENPTDVIEEIDDPLVRLYPYTYQEVLNEIPAILQAVAYNMDYMRDAADLLWLLAANDHRATNPNPEHPLRILRSLAELSPEKPKAFNHVMIDIASGWLEDVKIGDAGPSPFEVLGPILATEGSSHLSDGFSIRIEGYTFTAADVEALRDRVVDLAIKALASQNLKVACDAVEVIQSSLRGPMGMFGNVPTDEVRTSWVPLFVTVLEKLRAAVSEMVIDPVIGVALRRALHWQMEFGDDGIQDAARGVIEALPRSMESRMAVSIFDGWGELLEGRTDDYQEAELLKEQQADALVRDLVAEYSDERILELLIERLQAQTIAFARKAGTPGFFVWRLVRVRPDIGVMICEAVLADHDSILLDVVSVVLGCLFEHDGDLAVRFATALVSTGELTLRRTVGNALGWNRAGRSTLFDGEIGILRELSNDEDRYIRQVVATAARVLATHHRAEAISLACHIPFADSPEVADDVLQLFSDMGPFSWSDLPSDDADALLGQLEECDSVEEYWIQTFLAQLAQRFPTQVVALLMTRIERWEGRDGDLKYHPLPFHWHTSFQTLAHADLLPLLEKLRGWLAAAPDSWKRQDFGAQLFAVVANNFSHPDVMAFMLATIDGARTPETIRALSSILRQMPRELILNDSGFVAAVLESASNVGEDAVAEVGGSMHGAVTSGSYSGTPGQPFPRDVEQREQSMAQADALPTGSLVEKFYRSLQEAAEQRMRWQAERDERLLDNRDW